MNSGLTERPPRKDCAPSERTGGPGHQSAPDGTTDSDRLVAFFLTGERPPDAAPNDVAEQNLRPALFAGYRDLTKLRYDYPVVLIEGDGDWVISLSEIIDGILGEVAPKGIEGERVRKQFLALEREIRTLAAEGMCETLSTLWDLAAENLLSRTADPADQRLAESLKLGKAALRVQGEVVDCDAEVPARLLTHAWAQAHRTKTRNFRAQADALIWKLLDLLKADFAKSTAARTPELLKVSLGKSFEQAFDFEALSQVLIEAAPSDSLTEARRRRISGALSTLMSQKFFDDRNPADMGDARKGNQFHAFRFASCAAALDAFNARMAEMAGLVKALTIAELEVENRYNEAIHDPIFRKMDETPLADDDLAMFPSYLVCLRSGGADGTEMAKLIEILASGLPVKILVEADEIFGAPGRAFGMGGMQLASMAIGLNAASVLQSSSSNLYRMRDRVLGGMTNRGPSLFSIFSASPKAGGDSSSYLVSAAAHQSRAFPAFVFDPSAGTDWASRFSLDGNPQASRGWPVETFQYEDQDHQRHIEDIAFTYVDFVACDRRRGGYFLKVPPGAADQALIPVTEYLGRDAEGADEKIPYILMIDGDDVLHKVAVDNRLIEEARRCGAMWRNFQELGGIDNSHAQRLLEREREAWAREAETERQAPTSPPPVADDSQAPAAPVVPAEESVVEEQAEPEQVPSTEPYIETPRCTTCNECTEINGQIFAYNDNKQAYIADPKAGPYKDLVEAAESCQVSIIHPGEPSNPNEANLDALIKRAAPFR